MYEEGGIKLVTNVDEIAYFEIVDWIKNDCECKDVGRIFFRNTNCSLFNGRKEIIDDSQITNFLKSPEKDGWYNLYVVHGGTDLGEKELVNVEVDDVVESGVSRTNGPDKKDKRPKLKVISSKKNIWMRNKEL